MKAILPLVLAGVAGFTAYALVMGTVNIQARLASNGLSALGVAVQGAGTVLAAYAVFDFMNSRMVQSFKEAQEEFRKAEEDNLDRARRTRDANLELQDVKNAEVLRGIRQGIAEQRKAYFSVVDDAKEANKLLVEDSKATMGKLVEGAEKQVHALRNVAAEANRAVQSETKTIRGLSGNLEDYRFKTELEQKRPGTGPDAWRSQAELDRAERLRQSTGPSYSAQLRFAAPPRNEDERKRQEAQLEAFNKQHPTRSPESIQENLERLQRAKPFAEAAVQSSANWKQRQDAEAEYENILKSEIALHRELQTAEDQRAKSAAARAAEQEKHVTGMREAMKAYIADMELFDKKGNDLPEAKRQEQMAKAQRDLSHFFDEMSASGKAMPSDLLGFASLQRQLREAMSGAATKVEIKELALSPQALAKLNESITAGIGKIDFSKFTFVDPEKLSSLKTASEKFQLIDESATSLVQRRTI